MERVKVVGELHQLLLPVSPEEEDIANEPPQQVREETILPLPREQHHTLQDPHKETSKCWGTAAAHCHPKELQKQLRVKDKHRQIS